MRERESSALGLIPLHFDVSEHLIPLSQFIDSAKSTQDIIDNFNREFFDGKAKYEIRVRTPQPGGLIEILDVLVTFGAPIWAFMCTDIGKAYIKGLTGHEPSYWARVAGEKTRELTDIDKQQICKVLIALMVLGFLQKDTVDLEKTGLSKEKFRTAYTARNRVYQACIDNTEVRGLGFDTSHNFPIKRSDLPSFIVNVPTAKEEEVLKEQKSWRVDTIDLIVHSPNWKRDSNRKWQGSTSEKQDISFSIEDENFWHHVKVKDFSPSIIDNLQVQWAYPEQATKLTNVRVLRVLSYNGAPISKPLTKAELLAQLDSYEIIEKDQSDLFFTKAEGH